LTSLESRTLFGTLFFLCSVFFVSSLLHRPVLSRSLRNESCIRFFRFDYFTHSCREFSVPLSSFFPRVAFSSSSIELLFQLFAFLRILGLLFLIPFLFLQGVAVELNRAQQPVLQTKKGFCRCLSLSFLSSPPYFNFLSLLRRTIVRCSAMEKRRRGARRRAGAPFLIFPGTIVSA